jgi:hypothetical protein
MAPNKTSINWALLLPIGLLLLEAIAVIVLIISGYEISQVLFFFLIFLAIFLVFQIFRQLSTLWRVKHASSQLMQAQALIDSDQPMEAIKLLKEALFSLTESDYLSALKLMEQTYAKENMDDAVAQINAIHTESVHLFDMRKQVQRFTQQDRHNWQVQADKVRKMIQGLPEETGQSLSEARTDDSSH